MSIRVLELKKILASFCGVRPRPLTISAVFDDELWDPLMVRVARLLAGLLPSPYRRVRLHVACVLMAVLPAVILFTTTGRPPVAVLVAWIFNCYGMIAFPWFTWVLLRQAGKGLDDIWYTASGRTTRIIFTRQIQAHLSNRWQVAVGVLAGGGSAFVLTLRLPRGGDFLQFFLAYFLVGGLVGYCGYLLLITAKLCWEISKAQSLTLNFLAPFDTPGLKCSSNAMSRLAKLGLLLTFTFTGSLYMRFMNLQKSDIKESVSFTVVGALAGLGFVALVGLISQWWLAAPATEAVRVQLEALEAQAQPVRFPVDSIHYRNGLHRSGVSQHLSDYASRSSLKSSYINGNLITAYVTAAFGVIVQLVLAQLGFAP